MKQRFDLRKALKVYFPILFDLLGGRELDWRTVNQVLERKINEHTKKYEKNGGPIMVEASFFSLFVAAEKKVPEAISFLTFIGKVFTNLNHHLDDGERGLIRGNLYSMLTNIDKKYLNFVGELCVLNRFKTENKFKLIATEHPLDINNPKGVKVDFYLQSHDSKDLLLEVVNIHLEGAATWDETQTFNVIHQKISGKLNRKGMLSNPYTHLVPVVWGAYQDMLPVIKLYQDDKLKFQQTATPVGFISYGANIAETVHLFGRIDQIPDAIR